MVLLLFTIVDQNLMYKQISLSLCHDLSPCANFATPFLGPVPHRDKDYRIRSNFWKFYLIRTGFTLCERVLWVKVFRLFRLERFFLGVQSVDTVGRCMYNISAIGRFVMPCFSDKRNGIVF